MDNKKTISQNFLLIVGIALAGITLGQFLIFYIFFGFLSENSFLLVIASYLVSFADGLLPIFAATAIFFFSEKSTKGKALIALALSTPEILYVFPRFYLYFVTDVFNTAEALLLSAIISILYILYAFLQIFICIIILKRIVSRSYTESIPNRAQFSSFDDKANFGILMTVVLIFAIFFFRECYNTVSYFIEVKGGYTVEELLTMIISFLLIPIFSFLYYLISVSLKNSILSKKELKYCSDKAE